MPETEPYDELAGIPRLVLILAETEQVADHPGIAAQATQCLAYHLAPEWEDRPGLWRGYAAELRAAGFAVAERPDDDPAAEIAMLDLRGDALRGALAALDREADAAGGLLAVALAGGDALPVPSEQGDLGAPGVLLLRSPLSPAGWVSEEVVDHTSLLQLVERWTAARGRRVPAPVPAARRRLCGDLGRVLESRDPIDQGALPAFPGRRLARPVPYFPVAELTVGEAAVQVRLANIGPVARLAAPMVVDDGVALTRHAVPASPIDDQTRITVPVAIRDGRYDVTVAGPDHFHRRFAGSVPDVGLHCTVDYFADGDPWFPSLRFTAWHDLTLPIYFRLTRRLGERAASKSSAYGDGTFERYPGPRQQARFKEEPGANTYGWYDVAIASSADPAWVREYAGHLPTGSRPALAY